jgi:hypothetical protein
MTPTKTTPLGPGLDRFKPGSSLPTTPKLPWQEGGKITLSEVDQATFEGVRPLRKNPDLQLKMIDRLMKYYK